MKKHPYMNPSADGHHLPYPLNQGLRYHVPTYPRTRPSEPALANAGDVSVPFGKLRAGSGSLLCYRLPLHQASRLCSCLLLIIAVHLNKTYRGSLIGDLHPISSCPCRAYTKHCTRHFAPPWEIVGNLQFPKGSTKRG